VKAGQTVPGHRQVRMLDLPQTRFALGERADVHVHMNTGRLPVMRPHTSVFQASAENLPIVQDLVVNRNSGIPISCISAQRRTRFSLRASVLHGQEFHTSYWGHLGLLHLTRNYLLPDYVAYANTAAASHVSDERGALRPGS